MYCVGLREGDASDYNYLFNQYENSENAADMVVILRALGCTKDEASFNQYVFCKNFITITCLQCIDCTSFVMKYLFCFLSALPACMSVIEDNLHAIFH